MSIHFPASQLVSDYRELPTQPGVYFFFSPAGALLYIGKSNNLRTRVRTHLAATVGTSLTIAEQFASIGFVIRAGVIDTLLYESYAIKHFRPILNHQLRSREPAMAVVAEENLLGYFTCRTVAFSPTLPNESMVLAVARNKKKLHELLQYRQIKDKLCGRWLGLEKTSASCFAYQLGECSGACVKQECASDYNQRLLTAFESSRVSAWPHPEALKITEHNQETNLLATHHFMNWQHLMVEESQPDALGLYEGVGVGTEFDVDVYRILKRHLDSSG